MCGVALDIPSLPFISVRFFVARSEGKRPIQNDGESASVLPSVYMDILDLGRFPSWAFS